VPQPLILLIIRHAEKPDDPRAPWPGPGFTDQGVDNKKSLVIRGWQRAGTWSALFGAGLGGADYPKPGAIYAADPNAPDDPTVNPSQRPFQTAGPVAARLGLTLATTFKQGDETNLMKAVLKLSGVVLISWEHKAIAAQILPLIPVNPGVSVPAQWPGDRFDVVLRFDRAEGASTFAFRQLCPQMLSGDSGVGI
jgi:hypothetical protein